MGPEPPAAVQIPAKEDQRWETEANDEAAVSHQVVDPVLDRVDRGCCFSGSVHVVVGKKGVGVVDEGGVCKACNSFSTPW